MNIMKNLFWTTSLHMSQVDKRVFFVPSPSPSPSPPPFLNHCAWLKCGSEHGSFITTPLQVFWAGWGKARKVNDDVRGGGRVECVSERGICYDYQFRVALWALIMKLHFKSIGCEGTSPGSNLVLTFAGWNTVTSSLWDTHLIFKIVLRIEWNNNIWKALILAHSKLLLKMVAFVIISMNTTIIFIWPMVKEELQGKDQASCQDFENTQ